MPEATKYRIDRAFREAKMEVVDLLGRVVLSRELNREMDTITLPLRNRDGAYVILITVDGERYKSAKLIVQ